MKTSPSFTLIELLIVIGIISILTTVTVLAINPAEFFKEARDTKRIQHVRELSEAINLASLSNSLDKDGSYTNSCIGQSNPRIFVSVPSDNGETAPTAPSGWTIVRAATTENLNQTDGTGWLPIDFDTAANAIGSSLISALPIDQTNTFASGLYYTYICGSHEVTAALESIRKGALHLTDKGDDPDSFEVGNNLANGGTRGIIHYWSLDDGAGTFSKDWTGNANGTLTNMNPASDWTQGKLDGALNFDGSDDHISVPSSGVYDFGSQLTVCIWTHVNTLGNTGSFVNKADGVVPYTKLEFNFNLETDGRVRFWISGNGINAFNFAFSADPISTNTWHHACGVYTGTTIQVFVDGVAGNSVAETSGNIYRGTEPLRIGRANFIGDGLDGDIDDVRIYSRSLSAAEIQRIYNLTKTE